MISIDYTLIIVILNFVFLLIILNSLLYKPLKKFLSERQVTISQDLDKAQEYRLETEKLLEQQQLEYKQQSSEIRKMKEKTLKDADVQKEVIIKEARNREKEILVETEKQLAQEKIKAIQDLEKDLGDKVAMLTAKIIGKNIDEKFDAALIDRLLHE